MHLVSSECYRYHCQLEHHYSDNYVDFILMIILKHYLYNNKPQINYLKTDKHNTVMNWPAQKTWRVSLQSRTPNHDIWLVQPCKSTVHIDRSWSTFVQNAFDIIGNCNSEPLVLSAISRISPYIAPIDRICNKKQFYINLFYINPIDTGNTSNIL